MKTKSHIKFYKSYVLLEIHSELNRFNNYSIEEVDQLLKHNAGIEKSCLKMTYEEINELIVRSFEFGDKIGLSLNYRGNEYDLAK